MFIDFFWIFNPNLGARTSILWFLSIFYTMFKSKSFISRFVYDFQANFESKDSYSLISFVFPAQILKRSYSFISLKFSSLIFKQRRFFLDFFCTFCLNFWRTYISWFISNFLAKFGAKIHIPWFILDFLVKFCNKCSFSLISFTFFFSNFGSNQSYSLISLWFLWPYLRSMTHISRFLLDFLFILFSKDFSTLGFLSEFWPKFEAKTLFLWFLSVSCHVWEQQILFVDFFQIF